jgi:hypothetical protein
MAHLGHKVALPVGVVCLRPRQRRSLHPMDDLLATELLYVMFDFVLETHLSLRLRTLVFVIRNNYIHNFMQRLEY